MRGRLAELLRIFLFPGLFKERAEKTFIFLAVEGMSTALETRLQGQIMDFLYTTWGWFEPEHHVQVDRDFKDAADENALLTMKVINLMMLEAANPVVYNLLEGIYERNQVHLLEQLRIQRDTEVANKKVNKVCI